MHGIRLSRGLHKEKDVADALTGTFNPSESRGLHLIERLSAGKELSREQMIGLAHIFSVLAKIDFPRDFTRRRDLLVKWFDDHFEVLEPFATVIHLHFDPQ
jgi:hypothetical protein